MSIEGFLELSKEDAESVDGVLPMTDVCGNAVITALRTFPWGCLLYTSISEDREGIHHDKNVRGDSDIYSDVYKRQLPTSNTIFIATANSLQNIPDSRCV